MVTTKAGGLGRDRLVEDIRALGVEADDTVLMHSNLRELAPVREILAAPDGGMKWLIEAFREVLGPGGTLAVPTLTKCFKGEGGPVGQVWHPKKTPSRVGQITNYVLAQPDSFRSDHPTHPLGAIGGRAEEFCRGHSWRDGATTFDRKGPWGHLADWDGKVMWLGTTMHTQTMVHALEDWMNLPYMATLTALVEDPEGVTREVPVTRSPAGCRDFYREESKCALAWEKAGKMKKGAVCDAPSALMSARDFADWLWGAIKRQPDLLLCDRPDCAFCSKWKKPTVEHVRKLKGSWKKM